MHGPLCSQIRNRTVRFWQILFLLGHSILLAFFSATDMGRTRELVILPTCTYKHISTKTSAAPEAEITHTLWPGDTGCSL